MALVDEKTPFLNLPLPHAENNSSDDVERLRAAYLLLDAFAQALSLTVQGKASQNHQHGMDAVTGLIDALAGKAAKDHKHGLADLTDTDLSTVANGQFLKFVGTKWQPATILPGDVPSFEAAINARLALTGGTLTGDLSFDATQTQRTFGFDLPNGGGYYIFARPSDGRLGWWDNKAERVIFEYDPAGGGKLLTGVPVHSEGAAVWHASNLNPSLLSGLRNKIINGNFDIWQRAASQTASGYGSDDRWVNDHVGSGKTHSQQPFALGQTDVPGNPRFYSRTVVTSAAGAGNYVSKRHRIERVETLSGKAVTLTFWAKADAARNIAVEFLQFFGTGGSPSASVSGIGAQKVALTTSWQRYSLVVTVPSVAGKTLGSNGNDYCEVSFWFDAGSSYDGRTASLGQQSGTFDIARVSLVEGNAGTEPDPFSPRHLQQELALCMRYYHRLSGRMVGGYSSTGPVNINYSHPVRMRVGPAVAMGPGSAGVTSVEPYPDTVVFSVGTNVNGVVGDGTTFDAEL